MFCQVCGSEINSLLEACARCHQNPQSGRNFCHNCGSATNPAAVICTSCGAALAPPPQSNPYVAPNYAPPQSHQPLREPHYGGGPNIANANNNRIAAGVLGLLRGAFGIHKFILGYTTEGIIMLLVSVLGSVITCGMSVAVMWLIGFIEGIIYLTKTDDQFINEYVVRKRGWF